MENNYFYKERRPIGPLDDYTIECIEKVESYFAKANQVAEFELQVPEPLETQTCFNIINQANPPLCELMLTQYWASTATRKKLRSLMEEVGPPFIVNLVDQPPSYLEFDFSLHGIFYHGLAIVAVGPKWIAEASSARTKLSASLEIWFDKAHNKGKSGIGSSVSMRRKGLEGRFKAETYLSFQELKDNITFQIEVPDSGFTVGFQLQNKTVKQTVQPSDAPISYGFVASGDTKIKGVNVNLGCSTFLAEKAGQEEEEEEEAELSQEGPQEAENTDTEQPDNGFSAPRHVRHRTGMSEQVICPEPPATYSNHGGAYTPLSAFVSLALSLNLSIGPLFRLKLFLERRGIKLPFWLSGHKSEEDNHKSKKGGDKRQESEKERKSEQGES